MSAIRGGGLTFCSIISKSYLGPARALAESIRAHHPAADVFVLLLDDPDGYFRPEAEPFTAVTLDQLGRADAPRLRFQYTPFELSCAAKPWLIAHLLRHHPARKLVYFDSDILVLGNLAPLRRLLDRHPIVITPHLTAPYADDKHPGELAMSRSGAYNMGFFAVARCDETDRFLHWWGRRLERDCLHDVEHGLFVDQKWADLIPGMFPGVHVLRDPGYNVAYWNLHCRELAVRDDGAVTANGGPCHFFHFSGFDPDDGKVSRYQNRYELDDLGPARRLFEHYAGRLRAHGHATSRTWPYTWSRFDNGAAIPDLVRRLYHRLGTEAARFGDPFRTAGPASFFAWLTSAEPPELPPLLRAIHHHRADVRAAMPDVTGKDREAFLSWWHHHGVKEHPLDPPVLAALTAPPAAGPLRPNYGFAGGRPGPVTESYGINVLGFLQSEKGMGEACRSTVRSADAAGIPQALNNWVDGGSANRDSTFTDLRTDNPYPVNVVHLNASDAPYLLEHFGWYFEGRYNVGYWNWELDWFPDEWRSSFDLYDEVWAPSEFTRQAFARRSPVPVYHVPYAITVPPPRPGALTRARLNLPAGAFVFLFAFDFHSYFARKNPVAVVEAFRRAFGRRRDVLLVLKPMRTDAAPSQWGELLIAAQGQPNVRVLREVLSRDDMYALLRLSDAYVALHRSEGFGLPLAEAMALGKPVVATDYSANVDFMDDSNSFPVAYRLVEIEEDHGPYKKGAVWADPDVGHAAEQMRRVVADPARTARVAARAKADIERTLSPEAVGRLIRARLDAILGTAPGRAVPAKAA